MRKILIQLLVIVALLLTSVLPAFAQEQFPEPFCGELDEEDCDLRFASSEAMFGLESYSTTLEYKLLQHGLPELPAETDSTLTIEGQYAFDDAARAAMLELANISREEPLKVAEAIAENPDLLLDLYSGMTSDLMLTLKEKRKEAAILLITHDLAVIAELCQRVVVMYGGKIQEIAEVVELFDRPLHPYTRGLMNSIPHAHKQGEKHERLEAIPGNVPSILNFPIGCEFCTRCTEKIEKCDTVEPPLVEITKGHFVRCHLVQPEIAGGQIHE